MGPSKIVSFEYNTIGAELSELSGNGHIQIRNVPIPGALIISVRITPLDMWVIQTLCDDIP